MVKYGRIKRNGSVTFMGRTRTYHIFLSDDEKGMLHNTINNKKPGKTIMNRCSILFELDENVSVHRTQIQIVKSFGVSKAMVSNIVRAYMDGGIQAIMSIKRNPKSNTRRKMDGRVEAEIIRIACGPAPEGRCRCRCVCWKSKYALNLMSLSGGKTSAVFKKTNCVPT